MENSANFSTIYRKPNESFRILNFKNNYIDSSSNDSDKNNRKGI